MCSYLVERANVLQFMSGKTDLNLGKAYGKVEQISIPREEVSFRSAYVTIVKFLIDIIKLD